MGIRDKEWARHSGSNFFIPWNRIKLSEFGNQRTEITDETVAIRANSLILEGQKSAIEGYLSEDQEFFEFIDGDLRYRAWHYAKKHLGVDLDEKLGGMKCVVVKKPESMVDAIFYQVSRGSDTVPLSQMDKAKAMRKLHVEEKVPVIEIAKRLMCSDQHVRDMIRLTEMAPELQQAVKAGAMRLTTALKTERAREEVRQEVKEKLERGEKVKGCDVEDGKLKTLSVEEIQQQIKIANKLMITPGTKKDSLINAGILKGLRIALRLEEKLK
jgi:hypothetical protein